MRRNAFVRLRRRLSYANVMATLAFFFALTGGAMAATKYLLATDTIPATSDLAGSTYGNPVIAAGKVTSGKIADGAITSSKFDSSATAPSAASLDGLTVTLGEAASVAIPPGDVRQLIVRCDAPNGTDRVPIHVNLSNAPDARILEEYWTDIFEDGKSAAHSIITVRVLNTGTTEETPTLQPLCLGVG